MPKKDLLYYQNLLGQPNIQAYLSMIRKGENTLGGNGYHKIVGESFFADLSRHPNVYKRKYNSTAAGAYQFIYGTWEADRKLLNLPDFSQKSQDIAALYEISEHDKAIDDILNGDIIHAIEKTKKKWRSLPGAKHDAINKHSLTLPEALNFYTQQGGTLNEANQKKPPTNVNNLSPYQPIANYLLEISKKKYSAKDIAAASSFWGSAGLITASAMLLTDLLAVFEHSVLNNKNQPQRKQINQKLAEKTAGSLYSPNQIENNDKLAVFNNFLFTSALSLTTGMEQGNTDLLNNFPLDVYEQGFDTGYKKHYPYRLGNNLEYSADNPGVIDFNKQGINQLPEGFSNRQPNRSSKVSSDKRAVNINLNKPMIDHLTINVKDAKEGISDMKRKVEEVLLEIINGISTTS